MKGVCTKIMILGAEIGSREEIMNYEWMGHKERKCIMDI